MNLTDAQIEALFAFTKRKFVKWYDLQVELVDHLANKIEALMEADPNLSFERALGNVYEGFGIFGFAHIIQQKEAQLRKQNDKLFWGEFFKQFNWPYVMRSSCLLVLIVVVNQFTIHSDILMVLLFGTEIIFSIHTYRFFNPKKVNKPLLMLQYSPLTNIAGFCYIQMWVNLSSKLLFGATVSNTMLLIYNLTLFLGLIGLIAGYVTSKKLTEKAKNQYPLAFT